MRNLACLLTCLGGALTLLPGCARTMRTAVLTDSISVVTQRDSVVITDSVRWLDSVRWTRWTRHMSADTIYFFRPGDNAPLAKVYGARSRDTMTERSETEVFDRRSGTRSGTDARTITEVERSEVTKEKEPVKAPWLAAVALLVCGACVGAVVYGTLFAVRKTG